ncbi:hypothetical protein J7I98_23530 [Streptomyces sp. ISL-98]|uniref:hypothetical protein n=1 Tax=Streptomyces sp. ISL-98 TaxID=2819192 RepID=UPI001BE6906D|nr:hypothetical protein [Streptomyces sp. ISL-98]MBT2508802.1 hypothetical protein [Streptomyces sp. ISL-98]
MTEPKRWRLEIHGEDYTGDCEDLDVSMPALVYDVPHNDGRGQRRVLGPRGFTVTLTNPSGRLRALVDCGNQVHPLKVAFEDQAVPVLVQFHEEWVEPGGVRKIFGCLAVSRDNEPKWVTEPQLAQA